MLKYRVVSVKNREAKIEIYNFHARDTYRQPVSGLDHFLRALELAGGTEISEEESEREYQLVCQHDELERIYPVREVNKND